MIAETPKIPERVDYWLNQWASWMRVKPSDEMELGHPSRIIPWIGGGESQRGEDWSETEEQNVWQYGCITMNKLIQDLPPTQQCAIGHTYAGDNWKFPRDNLFELLETASATLMLGMNKWGVL